MPVPRELFISHSSSDKKFVSRLTKVLRRHRIRFWYSRSHLIGAQQWHDEIGKALSRCDWFLLILSPAAARSTWVKRELLYALQDRHYDDRIIPILVRACTYGKMSWTLDSIERIDFANDFERGCRELFRIWNREYKPEAPKTRRKRYGKPVS